MPRQIEPPSLHQCSAGITGIQSHLKLHVDTRKGKSRNNDLTSHLGIQLWPSCTKGRALRTCTNPFSCTWVTSTHDMASPKRSRDIKCTPKKAQEKNIDLPTSSHGFKRWCIRAWRRLIAAILILNKLQHEMRRKQTRTAPLSFIVWFCFMAKYWELTDQINLCYIIV